MSLGAQDIQITFHEETHDLALSATFVYPDGATAPYSLVIKGYQYDLLAAFVARAPQMTFNGGAQPDASDVARVLLALNLPFAWGGPAPSAPAPQSLGDLDLAQGV